MDNSKRGLAKPRASVKAAESRLLGLVVAALIVGAVGVGVAVAGTGNGSLPGFPLGKPVCGMVSGADPTTAEWTVVAVARTKGVSCATARRVVHACTNGVVPGWRVSRVEFTSSLTSGHKQIDVRLVSGAVPGCLAGGGLLQAKPSGFFGPYQEPMKYPSKWPAPFAIVYKWTSPVTTYSATIPQWDISNVNLAGLLHNVDGSAASFWFEYGTTRDKLDQMTDRQNPPIGTGDVPVEMSAAVLHLKAKTRYFWRAAANIQEPGGSYKTVYGTIGSFVTKPYPNLASVANPCAETGGGVERQITEQLTLECTRRYTYTNSYNYFPIPTDVNYHGRVTCPRSDPRNLSSGATDISIPIPYIHYSVVLTFQHLVNYWRSNDSNRFVTVPGNNQNSAGSPEGPVPGWHNWDVAQWAYPGVSTSTDAQFWITCTNNWTATSGDQLAKGEGTDLPSDIAPSAPQDFRSARAPDGGIDASWSPPSSSSPSGIAGYFLTFRGWKKGAAKEIPETTAVSVTATGLEGHIYPGQIDIAKKSTPRDYEFAVAVAAVSKEGARGPATVINWQ